MNFLGIGGLEFILIFGVALFVVGPRRLAEGVRTGRKYYTELKRHRDELTALVTEAIDAEDLKRDFEKTKRDVLDEKVVGEIKGAGQDLRLDQVDDFDVMTGRSVPRAAARAQSSRRGDGKVGGESVPDLEVPAVPPNRTAAEGETS